MNLVRARVSRTPTGKKVEYSYKKENEIRFKDVPVRFVKSLDNFTLSFANSFWVEGEQEDIKARWFDKTKAT